MPRHMLLKFGTALLLLSFVLNLAWTEPAAAQTDGVTMTVTPYLGGHAKYGEWLPLRVNLSNAGADLVAEVRAEIAGSSGQAVYAAPAPLPSGARKEVVLYILPSTFVQEIAVHLVQGDQILAETQVKTALHSQDEYLIAVVAPDPDTLALLSGLALEGRASTQFVPLSLDDLPDRAEPLRSLDCLILTGADTTSLTPSQGEALRAWVEQGGQLLIGGGIGARNTLTGLPESLRPVRVGDTVELDELDGLAGFAGEPIQAPGPFLATLPADHQGWTVIRQDRQSLLIQKTLGEGWVGYLALDLAASPFDAWAGALHFWQKLLEPGSALPPHAPPDIPLHMLKSEQMNYALSNLPTLDLPSIRWLALLLGLYILLIGPVNYLLLRRWRRLDWAWITIPTLTLAFSLGGYGLGYSLRGNEVVINQISVIPLSPEGSRAAVRSYVGLFSPTRQDYDVRVGGDALVSALSYEPGGWSGSPYVPSTLDVLQSDPLLVRGMGVNQWAMQSFQAETWLEADELTLDTALAIEGNQVHATIRNGLGRPLHELVLVSGQRYARLGDMDTGESKEFEATLQGGEMGPPFPWGLFEHHFREPGKPPREAMLRQSILEAYFHTNWGPPVALADLTLLAWTDLNPLEVQVADVQATRLQTTLIVAHLPLPVVDGQVNLPPGLLFAQLIEVEGEAGECGPGGQIYIGQGRAVLEYQLSPALRGLEPTALTLHASPEEGNPAEALPLLSLYDWTAGEWVELEKVETGRPHTVPDPGRFVNPAGGAIRLQAHSDDFRGSCYQLDLGLEGKLPPAGSAQ